MEFMAYIFGPQGDSLERFITIQRIRKLVTLNTRLPIPLISY